MHDIRDMLTFPHSIPNKVEEKVVLIPDAGHPIFKENKFGAASMNRKFLSLQRPNGIASDE